jgi:hypothetical protein
MRRLITDSGTRSARCTADARVLPYYDCLAERGEVNASALAWSFGHDCITQVPGETGPHDCCLRRHVGPVVRARSSPRQSSSAQLRYNAIATGAPRPCADRAWYRFLIESWPARLIKALYTLVRTSCVAAGFRSGRRPTPVTALSEVLERCGTE